MLLDDELRGRLSLLKAEGLYREPADARERERLARVPGFVDASSNDYLGLAARPVSRETGAGGAGASRLVQGTRQQHVALEQEIADWVATPAALLFNSGYAANVGIVASLLEQDSLVFSDALNHASLIDGCRLSRASVKVYRHLDLQDLERQLSNTSAARGRWVLTESYFSMDGDGPDLATLRELCDRYEARLLVDDAHALGVYGPEGAGRCAEFAVTPEVLVGTLGKAVGSQGAFAAGSELLRTWLWNRARSFVFSTAPSPALCRHTSDNIRLVRRADAERQRLLAACSWFRSRLVGSGVPIPPTSFGPIVPVQVGSNERALAFAASLRRLGVLAQPIRPPTVPLGAARVRLTLTAALDSDQLEQLACHVESAWAACAS